MGLAAIEITGELLQEMLTQRSETVRVKCIEGLPEGAIFKSSHVREWKGTSVRKLRTVTLVFEHPEFTERQEGDVIPYINVTYERHYEKCKE